MFIFEDNTVTYVKNIKETTQCLLDLTNQLKD